MKRSELRRDRTGKYVILDANWLRGQTAEAVATFVGPVIGVARAVRAASNPERTLNLDTLFRTRGEEVKSLVRHSRINGGFERSPEPSKGLRVRSVADNARND